MPLINDEINHDLNWPENSIIVAANVAAQATKFSVTDKKLYVPVVTLLTQDNAKLLEQLKSGFKISTKKISGKTKSRFRLLN